MSKTKTPAKNGGKVQRTRGQETWHQFRKNKGAMVGLVVFALILIATIVAQIVYDYNTDITKMNATQMLLPPSWEHPFGTDHMGRDVLARVLYGARYSLTIGLGAVALSTIVGLVVGALAGYYGGFLDNLVMRAVDVFMVIPALLIVMIIVSVLGVSMTNLIIGLSIGSIPASARQVRAAILPVRNSEYVEAAKCIGVSDWRIICGHILPNSMSTIIVNTTIRIGGTIVAAAGYSFLGLGVPTPIPEWGAMLSDARSLMLDHPNLIIFPGIAILLTAMSINLIGDGLRDALDPKLKR